jgi:hypothetical protein
MVRQCIEDARALGHTFSLAHGLNWGSLTLVLINDVNACRAVADELYPLAERNKFPWPLTYARFLGGWVTARQEPSAAVFRPVLLTLIAEQQLHAARIADAE